MQTTLKKETLISESYPILKTNRLLFIMGIIIFRIMLDILYKDVITVKYYVYDFFYEPNLYKIVYSYISLFIYSVLISSFESRLKPSKIMFFILFLFTYVPNGSLYSLSGFQNQYMHISNVYWFFMIIGYKLINLKFKPCAVRKIPRIIGKFRDILPYIFLVYIVFTSYSYNGLSINLNIKDSVDMRLAYRENGLASIAEMFLPWAANVVFPLKIIDSIQGKHYVNIFIFCIAQALAFSINGTKTWLFLVGISMAVTLFIKKDKILGQMPWAFVLVNIATFVESRFTDYLFFTNYLCRRVFFATSYNNWYHINFFNENPKMYLTQNIFAWVRHLGVELPYSMSVSRIIGMLYYNKETNASSGTIAEAYGNLGYLGLIIYPLMIICFFKLMDIAADGLSVTYIMPILLVTTNYLMNGNVFTAMITYGYFFSLFYIYFQNRKNPVEHKKRFKIVLIKNAQHDNIPV